MARRRSMKLKKHHSRRNRSRGGASRRVRRSRRHQRGGNGNCGAPVAGGAACNAGNSSNYAIAMVGDAFRQMKQSFASAFS